MHIATNVAALKARLSEFLRQVKGGNDVIVTERGVPIARLTGLDPLEQRAARRVRLARAGVLALGSGKTTGSTAYPAAWRARRAGCARRPARGARRVPARKASSDVIPHVVCQHAID